MNEWFEKAMRDALGSAFGWACVIIATLVTGFCAGYWIGHRAVTGAEQTLKAFAQLPLLWLGFSQMFFAYVITALAWYLPLRYESHRLRFVAAGTNFVTWLIVIVSVVEQSKDAKFFHY
jgi:hypothetical protein